MYTCKTEHRGEVDSECDVVMSSNVLIPIPTHLIPIPIPFPSHGWSYSHSRGNPMGRMWSRSFPFPWRSSSLRQLWLSDWLIEWCKRNRGSAADEIFDNPRNRCGSERMAWYGKQASTEKGGSEWGETERVGGYGCWSHRCCCCCCKWHCWTEVYRIRCGRDVRYGLLRGLWYDNTAGLHLL